MLLKRFANYIGCIVFTCLLVFSGNASPEEMGGKTATVVPYISNQMDLVHIGFVVFRNQRKEVDVSDWHIDKTLKNAFITDLENTKQIKVSEPKIMPPDFFGLVEDTIQWATPYSKYDSPEFLKATRGIQSDYLIILYTYEASEPSSGIPMKHFGYLGGRGKRAVHETRNIIRPVSFAFIGAYIFDLRNKTYLNRYGVYTNAIFDKDREFDADELDAIYKFVTKDEFSDKVKEGYKSIIYGNNFYTEKGKQKLYKYFKEQNKTMEFFDDAMSTLEYMTHPSYTLPDHYEKLTNEEKEKMRTFLEEQIKVTAGTLVSKLSFKIPKESHDDEIYH